MSRRGLLDIIPLAVRGRPIVNAAQFNALVDAVRSGLNITGPRVITDSSGIYIAAQRIPKPEVGFRVVIDGTDSVGWPKQSRWAEVALVGSGQSSVYDVRRGGFHSDPTPGGPGQGLGINSVELMSGFGTTVGPYGQPLSNELITLTVLEVAIGSHPLMSFRKNASGFTVPVFEAINGVIPECTP